MKYRNHTIERSGDNYRVRDPRGFYWGEFAASTKTAKRWIDCQLTQSMLCADYAAHLERKTHRNVERKD